MPSERNPDDEPLRRCSDLDCTPSPESWSRAERFVGPQSFYLMAVDSNCQKDFRLNFLPHYAPWPTPGSDGVNHFATPLFLDLIFIRFRRLYSLVHFCLTFSIKINGAFKLVVSDLRPRPFWWATLVGDSSPLVVDRLAAWQEGIYLHVAFSYPKRTRMASL